ncbi:MAG: hypothetical protein ACYTJ0_05705, partial [Planctomycetota bacterium]
MLPTSCSTTSSGRGRDRCTPSSTFRWTAAAALTGAVALAGPRAALGQESPEGCNATSLGAALIPTVEGVPVPPGQCVIPGQGIQYIASVFVSENDPNKPDVIFCDAMGGQLSVTLPNYEDLPLRPDQYVRVAGFPDTDPTMIPAIGNQDGAANIFMAVVPQIYVVEASHANFQGLLNARVDYGQTAYMDLIGELQENAIVLSDPLQEGTASITKALPLCVPAVTLDKSAEPAQICEGVPTLVTFTLSVTNDSFENSPGTPQLPNLTNIQVMDDTCENIQGPFGDDGDGLLNPGETWTYTCTAMLSTSTTNTATVTANAVAVFPAGMVVDTLEYGDTATAEVTTNPNPITSASNSGPVCPGEPVQLFAEDGFAMYSWTGPGGFTSMEQNPIVDPAVEGEYCVVVTDQNGCEGEACTLVMLDVCEAACCFPDGSCQELTQDDCASAGGQYQGDGTTCETVECPESKGACCLPDGTCTVVLQAECDQLSGEFQGFQTTCAEVECPQPTGACCFQDGSCDVLLQAECTELG